MLWRHIIIVVVAQLLQSRAPATLDVFIVCRNTKLFYVGTFSALQGGPETIDTFACISRPDRCCEIYFWDCSRDDDYTDRIYRVKTDCCRDNTLCMTRAHTHTLQDLPVFRPFGLTAPRNIWAPCTFWKLLLLFLVLYIFPASLSVDTVQSKIKAEQQGPHICIEPGPHICIEPGPTFASTGAPHLYRTWPHICINNAPHLYRAWPNICINRGPTFVLHLAPTFVSNLVPHLYQQGPHICIEAGPHICIKAGPTFISTGAPHLYEPAPTFVSTGAPRLYQTYPTFVLKLAPNLYQQGPTFISKLAPTFVSTRAPHLYRSWPPHLYQQGSHICIEAGPHICIEPGLHRAGGKHTYHAIKQRQNTTNQHNHKLSSAWALRRWSPRHG